MALRAQAKAHVAFNAAARSHGGSVQDVRAIAAAVVDFPQQRLMASQAMLTARHTLIWPHAHAQWQTLTPGADTRLRAWFAAGFPAIVARSDADAPEQMLRLGVPLPALEGKQRLALYMPCDQVRQWCAPPLLEDVAAAQASPAVCALAVATKPLTPRVFGSYAWQWLTGLEYVGSQSDLDLLWSIEDATQADTVVGLLQQWEARHGLRADGELLLPSGDAVNWREYASGARQVLLKSPRGCCMRARTQLFHVTRTHTADPVSAQLARRLGRLAVASLHTELVLDPKPGLVTPSHNGSHADMDATSFMRSLFALRGYFRQIARAGAQAADFAQLRQLGLDAEAAMLRATGGINTHRGAIFSLGLLVAQAARLQACTGVPARAEQVCMALRQWREPLLAAPLNAASHGQRACHRHAVAGVREQAAAGYPLLRDVALPQLRAALTAGLSRQAALAQTLMSLMAVVDDLNVLHRGGRSGLRRVQRLATVFVAAGGAYRADWRQRMARIGKALVARNLSPGGSADLLACAWFLLCQEDA